MSDNDRHERWQCWLCGFNITPLHDPLALRGKFTNLHKDEASSTTMWHEVFAHAECVSERIPKPACFDPASLAEDLDADDATDFADDDGKSS